MKLFLLPFCSHFSTKNISFSYSGYVIKPPLFTELRFLQGTQTWRVQ